MLHIEALSTTEAEYVGNFMIRKEQVPTDAQVVPADDGFH